MVTFFDDFNRVDGAIGANWIQAPGITNGGFSIGSNQIIGGTANSVARWKTAITYTSVFSQAIYQGGLYVGPIVAASAFAAGPYAGAGTWYAFRTSNTGCQIGQKDAGLTSTPALVSSTTLPVAGDVLRLEYDGTTLTAKINGTIVLTYTPVTPISIASQPYVGIVQASTAYSGLAILDDWSGGDIPVPSVPLLQEAGISLLTESGPSLFTE